MGYELSILRHVILLISAQSNQITSFLGFLRCVVLHDKTPKPTHQQNSTKLMSISDNMMPVTIIFFQFNYLFQTLNHLEYIEGGCDSQCSLSCYKCDNNNITVINIIPSVYSIPKTNPKTASVNRANRRPLERTVIRIKRTHTNPRLPPHSHAHTQRLTLSFVHRRRRHHTHTNATTYNTHMHTCTHTIFIYRIIRIRLSTRSPKTASPCTRSHQWAY